MEGMDLDMINKVKYILILSVIFVVAMCTKSFAGITTNAASVESGGTVTLNISSQEPVASGAISVTSDGGLTFVDVTGGTKNGSTLAFSKSENITSGLATYTFKAPTVTETKTYTVKFSSVDMADEEGNEVKASSATATVTVKGNGAGNTNSNANSNTNTNTNENTNTNTNANTNTNTNSNANTPITPSKSSDATLKSLKIGDWSVAVQDKVDITVDSSYEKIAINAVPKDSKATLSGNGVGTVDLEEGTNNFKIIVKAEDGTTKEYKIIIRRKAETTAPSSPPNVVEEKEDDKKEEEKPKEEAEEFGLSNLVITGIKLNPTFDINVFEYTAEFSEDTDVLEVITKANAEDATVEVVGNTNLKIGENLITVMVKSADGEITKTYQITVTKNEPLVETSATTNDTLMNTVAAGIESNQEVKKKLGRIGLIAAAAIVAVILLGIIVIMNTKKKEDNDFGEENIKPKKNKFGKEDFRVAVNEEEAYRELEKLSNIHNRNNILNEEQNNLIDNKEENKNNSNHEIGNGDINVGTGNENLNQEIPEKVIPNIDRNIDMNGSVDSNISGNIDNNIDSLNFGTNNNPEDKKSLEQLVNDSIPEEVILEEQKMHNPYEEIKNDFLAGFGNNNNNTYNENNFKVDDYTNNNYTANEYKTNNYTANNTETLSTSEASKKLEEIKTEYLQNEIGKTENTKHKKSKGKRFK